MLSCACIPHRLSPSPEFISLLFAVLHWERLSFLTHLSLLHRSAMSSVALLRTLKKEPLSPNETNGRARSADHPRSIRSSLLSWLLHVGPYVMLGLALGFVIMWTAQFNSLVAPILYPAYQQQQPQQCTQPAAATTTAVSSMLSSSSSFSPVDSTKHCVMAMAAGYSFETIYVFIRSLRTQCEDCQVVLFVDSSKLTASDQRHFQHFRIQLIYVDQIQPLYADNTLTNPQKNVNPAHYRWELYFDYLIALLGDERLAASGLIEKIKHRKANNPITASLIHASRERAYNTSNFYNDPYARPGSAAHPIPSADLPTSLAHVFFCDARDLIFQHNIFNFLPYRHQFEHDDYLYQARHVPSLLPPSTKQPTADGLFVFTEERPLIEEGINIMWINCAAHDIIKPGRPVLCSGSSLASVQSAIVYLDAMISTMLKHMVVHAAVQRVRSGRSSDSHLRRSVGRADGRVLHPQRAWASGHHQHDEPPAASDGVRPAAQ